VNLLNRLKIAQKLSLAFGTIIGCCLLLGAFSVYELATINHAADQLGNNYLPSVSTLAAMDNRLGSMRRTELRMLLAGREPLAEIAQGDGFARDLAARQKEYEPRISSPEEKQLYEKFKETLSTYAAGIGHVRELQRAGQLEAATAYATKEDMVFFRSASAALSADIKYNDAEAVTFTKDAAEKYATSKMLILLLLGVSVALSLGLGTLITRSITVPLGHAADVLSKVAEGDLTYRLEVVSRDEVGVMSGALNQMIESLSALLTTVAENATQLAAASEEISASASMSSESAKNQADQTTQVATAMHEMSATVIEVGNNSQQAANAAHEASDTARNGGKVVTETLETMRSIAASTTAVAAKITELGKSSERIGAIAAVIDDIADQTNLLALNAAIEAARAGEQGRGFAVVADEVRKLAERTATATKEIAGMIESIQQDSRDAVGAMKKGTHEVELGVVKTEGSGKALDKIIEMASRVGDMVAQIATAATEQSTTAEMVNDNIANIAEMTTQSSINAGETAKACSSLSNLAFNLQTVVGNFKLDTSERRPDSSQHRNPQPAFRDEHNYGTLQ
jgi:methyl-accepting chemotaxis protein